MICKSEEYECLASLDFRRTRPISGSESVNPVWDDGLQ